jgi:hypothetical protein
VSSLVDICQEDTNSSTYGIENDEGYNGWIIIICQFEFVIGKDKSVAD